MRDVERISLWSCGQFGCLIHGRVEGKASFATPLIRTWHMSVDWMRLV